MAQLVLGIATILALHSLGLIIASLVTNKWYTDSKKDIGVYGICEHLQTVSNFNDTYYYYRNKYSYTTSNNKTMAAANNYNNYHHTQNSNSGSNNNSSSSRSREKTLSRVSVGQKRLFKKRRNNNIVLIAEDNSLSPIASAVSSSEKNESSVANSGVIKKSTNNTKCYQLIWPDSQQAYQYLIVKTTYKITLMGVSICSVSFALLTSIWSIACAIFSKLGSNVRANEVLIGLSIIAGILFFILKLFNREFLFNFLIFF